MMMKQNKDDGIALISVFGALIILSFMAMSVLSLGRQNRSLSQNIYQQSEAEYIADAGISYALYNLTSRDAVRNIPSGVSELDYQFSGETVKLTIIPEEGKIDINTAEPEMISGLLAYFGLDEISAANVEEAVLQKRSDEDGAIFYTLEEFYDMVVIPKELISCIAPYISVHSQKVGVDLNLATSEMVEFVNWADERRWGGERWFNTDGSTTSQKVTSISSSNKRVRTYSGRAFTINARSHTSAGSIINKKAIVRVTGNIREAYWMYVAQANYITFDDTCRHM